MCQQNQFPPQRNIILSSLDLVPLEKCVTGLTIVFHLNAYKSVHSFCCGGHVSGCHVAKSGEMEMAARIL
jgi:hypothetical protein